MARSKEGKDQEFYLGIIRQQKAEIRNLKKRIRRLEKDVLLKEYTDSEAENIIDPVEIKADCPSCKNGSLTELVVVGRSMMQCNSCPYRSKAVKL